MNVTTTWQKINTDNQQQIIRISNLYTPADELEDRIPMTFIRKFQEELQKRDDLQAQSKLQMDTQFAY